MALGVSYKDVLPPVYLSIQSFCNMRPGQAENESRSVAGLGLHTNIAAMLEDRLPRQRESQSQAVPFAGRNKWLEKSGTDFRCDAWPSVFHRHDCGPICNHGRDPQS